MKGWIPLPGSDAALVRKALRDDPRAFEALVFRYQRRAHAVARAIGVPAGSVEDIVQESFLKAFEGLPHLRSPESFGPWVLAIVRNAARRSVRERKPATEPLEESAAAAPESPESLERRELKDLLWRKVAALPEPIREAIFLYYHEGESPRAVAATQGISRAAALKRLQRGRDLLREDLWRELEESLRDLLPSAREWKRKGRQLTILVLGMVATSWGIRAAPSVAGTAAAGTGVLGGLAGNGAVKALVMGGVEMSLKNVAVAVAVTVLAVLGSLLFIFRTPGPERGEEARPAPRGERLAERASSPKGAAGEDRIAGGTGAAGGEAADAKAGLPASLSIYGTITDRTGKGVAGARVLALPAKEWDLFASRFGGEPVWTLSDGSLSREVQELFREYRSRADKLPRTTSFEDGKYRLEGLEAGEHRVLASHQDHLPSGDASAWVSAEGPVRLDLQLDPAKSIAGSVRDEEGRPVAGAAVAARPSRTRRLRGDERKEELLSALQEGKFLLGDPRTTSDGSGAFRLRALAPEPYDVTVRKDGFAEARRAEVPPGEKDLVVVLSRGSSLTGGLLDPDRSPVAGAEAALSFLQDGKPRPTAVGEALYEDAVPEDPHAVEAPATATTDAGGRFEFRGLGPGEYRLVLRAGEHPTIERSLRIADRSLDLGSLVLDPAGSISGRVLDARGAPAAEAVVWIEDPPEGGVPAWVGRAFRPRRRCETRVDARGQFLLAGLPRGNFTLRASSRDLAPAVLPNVASGTAGVEVRLANGGEVRGRVLDGSSRAAIAGAEVSLGFAGTASEAIPGKTTLSGRDGSFLIRGAPQDDRALRLHASHPHYGGRPADQEVDRNSPGDPVEVLLFQPERISGRVIDARGEPVAGARVAIEVPGWKKLYVLRDVVPASPGARSGSDGAFALEVPRSVRNPHTTIEIVARRGGLGVGRSGPVRPEEQGPWPEVEVTIRGCGLLSGKVVDRDGRPVNGAAVRAARVLGANEHQRTLGEAQTGYSGRDGSYAIGELEPGAYDLEVSRVGYSRQWVEDLEVGEGPRVQDVALDPGLAIEGRVVESGGAAAVGAEVFALLTEEPDLDPTDRTSYLRRLRQRQHPGIASTRTDAEGRYRLSHLPPRSVTLVARAVGCAPSALEVVPPGETPADLVLTRLAGLAGSVAEASTGRPVSLFQLSAERKAEEGRPDGRVTMIPRDFDHPHGEFAVEGLEPGRYTVAVRAAGYFLWVREVDLRGGEVTALEAKLEEGRTLRGAVREVDGGAGIPGVTVRVAGAEQRRGVMITTPSAWTAEDGAFAVTGLEPGEATVYVFHADYSPEKGSYRVQVGEEEPAPIEMRMIRAGRLRGKIGNPKREWTFDTRVVLERPAGEKGAEKLRGLYSPVKPDGDYEVRSIPPGTYQVILRDMRPRDSQLDLTRPGITFRFDELEERLTPLGTVEIRAGETAVLDGRAP